MKHLSPCKTTLYCILIGLLAPLPLLAIDATAAHGDTHAHKDFSLYDQDGNLVTLSDLQGKFVVLEWINPDCPFVKRHYQADTMTMAKLAQAYKDKGVVWLSINSTHYFTQEKNKAWHQEKKLTHQILDDHTGKVGRLFGAKTTPHLFILDQSGHKVYEGAIDSFSRGQDPASVTNYVQAVLDDLLAKKDLRYQKTKSYGCSVKYAK
ncbi:redoxin domain-containing protein [Planctomycetota bacterium]